MSDLIEPRDHAEAVALFRLTIVGHLHNVALARGELRTELEALSQRRFRPPGSAVTRTYSVPTLRRWLSRYKKKGLDGLRPESRRHGFAQGLTYEQKILIEAVAVEHPNAPVSVIAKTLRKEDLIDPEAVSDNTIRRFLADRGLDAVARRVEAKGKIRRRWQAAFPGQIWHADVCHGAPIRVDGRSVPVRVHAILDDASRYIVAIRAYSTEREVDMLELFVEALTLHGPPKTLYLDNGSTYRGEVLQLMCERLGVKLVHAQPYDPEARGKMERFWRTLRQGCLNYTGGLGSLHDVQSRLLAFLDHDYLPVPHAGLMARCPADVYGTDRPDIEPVDKNRLRDALTVRATRRVKRDGTLAIGGIDWETDAGFLAGRKVTVKRTLFEPERAPWIEHEDQTFPLQPVNPVTNGRTPRKSPKRVRQKIDLIPFDPATATLNKLLKRKKSKA